VYNIYFHTSVSIIKVLAFLINIAPQTLFRLHATNSSDQRFNEPAQSQTDIIFMGILINSNWRMCSILHCFALGCNLQDPSPNIKWGVAIYSSPLLVIAWQKLWHYVCFFLKTIFIVLCTRLAWNMSVYNLCLCSSRLHGKYFSSWDVLDIQCTM
jgi:hypothetical protein